MSENLWVWGKTSKHLVTISFRSEVFHVGRKGDIQERETRRRVRSKVVSTQDERKLFKENKSMYKGMLYAMVVQMLLSGADVAKY